MAVYGYACARCGAFEVVRAMGGASPQESCPVCGEWAPRVFSAPALTAPHAPLRQARDAADRSAHQPAVVERPPPQPRRRSPAATRPRRKLPWP